MAPKIVAKEGKGFTKAEHNAFIDLVLAGGEVAEHTLRRNVPVAKSLVYLRDGEDLLGVAALKKPLPAYRQDIRHKAGVAVHEADFPFELGYVFVVPAARRKGHSEKLSAAALAAAGRNGVFATARTDNPAMHATLDKFGFEKAGTPYAGRDASEKIQLFLRRARQT